MQKKMGTVELRTKPELKITINQNGFQILDSADPVNNGEYSFLKLNKVELHPGQTDWLVSILSVVVDLITGGGNSGKFKNKPNIKFKLDNKTFKLYLADADLEKAKAITDLLNQKSLHTTIYILRTIKLASSCCFYTRRCDTFDQNNNIEI